MDFLLWIALTGVIVFLLGLIYSRLNRKSAREPAAKTISPAVTPASPAQRNKTESQPAPAPVKKATEAPQQKPAKPAEPVSIAPVEAVKTDAPAPVAKPVPAAEPVGPAHSEAPAVKQTESEAPAIISQQEEQPVATAPQEPELLKKPRQAGADDLTLIGGIGKAIQDKLNKAGIFHYDQLADLNPEQTAWLNRATGFAGRAERENWSAQAKKLQAKSTSTKQEPAKRITKTATKSPAAKTRTATKPKAKAVKKP